MRRAGSVLFWTFFFVSSAVCFVGAVLIWIVTVAFDRRLAVLHMYTCAWASLYTVCNPAWPVEIRGLERIDRRKAYVMVANHQSVVDIFVLHRLFRHFKWVSKASNFKLPFVGWNMRLNRYIALRRGDRASVEAMFASCQEALRNGSSIMMFPEGTRSADGELRPFKLGAFELATSARVPVLPIVVEGTHRALPKRGFAIQKQSIRVTVLEEVSAAGFDDDQAEQLRDFVRERFVEFLRGRA